MGSHLFDHPLWSIFLCFNNVICFRYLYWINISLWPWINHSHITHIQSHKSGIYFYFLFRKFSILCLKRDLIHRQKKTTVFEHCWSLHASPPKPPRLDKKIKCMRNDQTWGTWTRLLNVRRFVSGKRHLSKYSKNIVESKKKCCGIYVTSFSVFHSEVNSEYWSQ